MHNKLCTSNFMVIPKDMRSQLCNITVEAYTKQVLANYVKNHYKTNFNFDILIPWIITRLFEEKMVLLHNCMLTTDNTPPPPVHLFWSNFSYAFKSRKELLSIKVIFEKKSYHFSMIHAYLIQFSNFTSIAASLQ